MAKDLTDAFPDMSGFSPRNIKYMRNQVHEKICRVLA
ncbi:MAG: hypothetical protein MR528_01930 [Lachnospiraceae bacterium]|nr:hypothetical protein [Lachnospiraceae bacterium]